MDWHIVVCNKNKCYYILISWFPQKYNKNKQLFNTDNNKKCSQAANQNIRMISEGLRDAKDWH